MMKRVFTSKSQHLLYVGDKPGTDSPPSFFPYPSLSFLPFPFHLLLFLSLYPALYINPTPPHCSCFFVRKIICKSPLNMQILLTSDNWDMISWEIHPLSSSILPETQQLQFSMTLLSRWWTHLTSMLDIQVLKCPIM